MGFVINLNIRALSKSQLAFIPLSYNGPEFNCTVRDFLTCASIHVRCWLDQFKSMFTEMCFVNVTFIKRNPSYESQIVWPQRQRYNSYVEKGALEQHLVVLPALLF